MLNPMLIALLCIQSLFFWSPQQALADASPIVLAQAKEPVPEGETAAEETEDEDEEPDCD